MTIKVTVFNMYAITQSILKMPVGLKFVNVLISHINITYILFLYIGGNYWKVTFLNVVSISE